MDNEIVVFVVVVGVLIILLTAKRNKHGRWNDEDADLEKVVESIAKFSAQSNPKLKRGYTESSIERQLTNHLKLDFESVNSQKGLSGINGHKIDIDVGRGAVGIELKIARELFKSRSLQTLSGQVEDYLRHYDSDEFLVIVFASAQELTERVWMKEVEDRLRSKSVKVLWCEVSN